MAKPSRRSRCFEHPFLLASAVLNFTKCNFLASTFFYSCSSSKIHRLSILLLRPLMAIITFNLTIVYMYMRYYHNAIAQWQYSPASVPWGSYQTLYIGLISDLSTSYGEIWLVRIYNHGTSTGYTPRCKWQWDLVYRGPAGHEVHVW